MGLLKNQEVSNYYEFGFIIQHDIINEKFIKKLLIELEHLCTIDSEKKIIEENGLPCSLYIGERDSTLIDKLTRHPIVLSTAENLLESQVYLHQCKYNAKLGYFGSEVMWHQDFYYWNKFDGMPTSRVLTAALLLDNVDYFNSPLWFINKSHNYSPKKKQKDIKPLAANGVELSWTNTRKDKENTIVGDLRYIIEKHELQTLIQQGGAPTPFVGRAGSIAYFHGSTIHGSTKNLSPWDRRMLFITYNSVDNRLIDIINPRANFVANRDYTPLMQCSSKI